MKHRFFTRKSGETQNPDALHMMEQPGFETNNIEAAVERLAEHDGGGWIYDENGRPVRYVAPAPHWTAGRY